MNLASPCPCHVSVLYIPTRTTFLYNGSFGADLDSTPVTKLLCACRDDSESRKPKAVNY